MDEEDKPVDDVILYPWEAQKKVRPHRRVVAADNKLTRREVYYIKYQIASVSQLASLHQVDTATVTRWYWERTGTKRGGKLTDLEKPVFLAELRQSPIPAVTLAIWGMVGASAAWSMVKAKTAKEFQAGTPTGKQVLAKNFLAIKHGGVLYSTSQRSGAPRTARNSHYKLSRMDIYMIATDLDHWLELNKKKIAGLFPKEKSSVPKRLTKRWHYAQLTYAMIEKGHTSEGVKRLVGTSRYYAACKRAFTSGTPWWDTIFTDEELTKLREVEL